MLDVLLRRQLRDQLTELEHEPEPGPAQVAAPVLAQGVQPPPVEPDLALIGGQDAGQAVQQRRLAGSARAHDRDDLAPVHADGGAAQGRRRPERLDDAACLDDPLRLAGRGGPVAGGRHGGLVVGGRHGGLVAGGRHGGLVVGGHRRTACASVSSRAAV
jgi:hypothetical protein